MGYIKLVCLVIYVWYLKGFFSYIVNFLDKFFKKLEGLVYGDFFFVRFSVKKFIFLWLWGLFEDEILFCNYSIFFFFFILGFVIFWNWEIVIGVGVIRE